MVNLKIAKPDRVLISCLVLFIVTLTSYSLTVNKVSAATCQSPAVTYIDAASLKSLSS